MKELKYFNGYKLCTVRMGEDLVSFITFDEESKIAKVSYKDGTTVTITSPFMVFKEPIIPFTY